MCQGQKDIHRKLEILSELQLTTKKESKIHFQQVERKIS